MKWGESLLQSPVTAVTTALHFYSSAFRPASDAIKTHAEQENQQKNFMRHSFTERQKF